MMPWLRGERYGFARSAERLREPSKNYEVGVTSRTSKRPQQEPRDLVASRDRQRALTGERRVGGWFGHDLSVGFRRSTSEAEKARRWRRFAETERPLFEQAGLPGIFSQDRAAFDDFLRHGFLAMPGGLADGTFFDDSELDVSQRDPLDELVKRYVNQFGDPGVALGPRPDRAS
jgi:hypothetical protein